MHEKFSFTKSQSKNIKRQEIEEGWAEYLNLPRSKEGVHIDLEYYFESRKAEKPLKKTEIEEEAEKFIDENFEKLIPMITETGVTQDQIIDELGLTNEQIGLLNADYYIKRDEDGKAKIFQHEYEVYPILSDDLLALAYAKDNIRTDTQNETGKVGSGITHRYHLKSQDRYLCENDFGMRVWDEDEGRMIAGDVSDITPFIQTLKYQFGRIQENILAFYDNLKQQLEKVIQEQVPPVNIEDYENNEDYREAVREQSVKINETVQAEATTELFRLFENPKNKELLLEAVPVRKVRNQLHFNYQKIADKYGLISNNSIADYENFNHYGSERIEKLLREPTESERGGASINFLHSDFYDKPVVVSDNFEKDAIIDKAKSGVQSLLAYNAAMVTPEMHDVFNRYRCQRGEQSPYYYPDHKLYDFINTVGLENVSKILDSDYRNVSKQLTALHYLQKMNYDISRFDPDDLKKQLYEANKLDESYIWDYLSGSQSGRRSGRRRNSHRRNRRERENVPSENIDKDWLEAIGENRAKALFRKGKQMYWLALQVYMKDPNRHEDDRFYNEHSHIDWQRYDLTKTGISEEKLNEYLHSHINFIVALLEQDHEKHYDEEEKMQTPATLELIIQALEKGQDLRGVAIANDKQRYLEGIIKGEVEDDLEFALKDWPAERREVLTKEEISLYYEYANDYVLTNPNGLAKYAEWRAGEDGEKWTELFAESVNRKSDLDFRICLGKQNDEVRDWYREGAEYVGNKLMQDYLMRFNTTQNEDGGPADLHDTLYWVPNIKRLDMSEAKSVLADIQTMGENQEFIQLIARYAKEKDPFVNQSIQSLRELRKRILAIESNIDLSKFPPELVNITTAPGFNLSALESMMNKQDFKDLLDGKLDTQQPFKPHKRMFTSRDLTDVLQEGLGSRSPGKEISGTADFPRKLFHQLRTMIAGRTLGDRKMIVKDLLKDIPTDLEEEIMTLLQEQNVDIGPIIEAEVHAKSDPKGWVSGNYTDCCMPFGSSINTDYMFNPSTQYFTIKQSGRIVAQSVIVDGQDKRDGGDVVILDNIEVANNYKKLAPLLSRAYQTFWTEYTSKPVKVGTGHSDLIPPGGVLETNNFSSKTKLEYSDADGSKIYDLPKIKGLESADQIISFANLTERDAELIKQMEAEAYPEEMTQGKDHILNIIKKQRELEVPGAASSFVVRKGNEPAGYMLLLPEKSKINSDEQVAHIYDMVVLPKFQGSNIARKMMQRTLDVASAYNVSIEAEARANTSYALLMNKRIQRWIESNGFTLTKNEKLPEYLGNEDFYFVRFENNKTDHV